jgi:N-acetylmuramoyl-L-alanine amidase
MKLLATLALSITALAAQSSRAGLQTVNAVRHWSLSEVTRVAVEVSGSFEYRTERLHNPERVYYDILHARPRIDSRRSFSEDLNDKLVSKLRVAETAPGVTRIVLDLINSAEATTSQLTNPDRLIIELRPVAMAPPVVPTVAPMSPLPTILNPPRPEPPTAPLKPAARPRTDVAEAIAAPVIPPPLPAETSKAARPTSKGNTSLIRALGLKLGRVVIDPGHGGHDHGTQSGRGLLEKDLVLDVSKRVGKLIEENLGAEVVYTRTDDTFIPLDSRALVAVDHKADLFLSIHANSSPVTRISGVETYYRHITTSKDALEVAARENASSQKSIADLESILVNVMKGDKVEESREFAGRIQESLYSFSKRNFPGTKDRGVKSAPLLVLVGAKVPSVLVEVGFLSNSREEAMLRRAEYRQKLAEALYRGIARYAESLSHNQVAKAGDE